MKRFSVALVVPAVAGTLIFFAGARPAQATPIAPNGSYGVLQDRDDRGWEAPPGELNEVERRGFHDGVEGARKDFDNHRPPSVNNREEYRHPPVPHRDREAYKRGFERGYGAGVEHIYHQHVR